MYFVLVHSSIPVPYNSHSPHSSCPDGGPCVRVSSHVTLRLTSPGLRPLPPQPPLSLYPHTQILNQVRIFLLQDHVTSPSKVHDVPE